MEVAGKMIKDTLEADSLFKAYLSQKLANLANSPSVLSNHSQDIVFPKLILKYLEIFKKFNIFVSCAANLVHVERVPSELLRIWFC